MVKTPCLSVPPPNRQAREGSTKWLNFLIYLKKRINREYNCLVSDLSWCDNCLLELIAGRVGNFGKFSK
jgi:hypothetical protein